MSEINHHAHSGMPKIDRMATAVLLGMDTVSKATNFTQANRKSLRRE